MLRKEMEDRHADEVAKLEEEMSELKLGNEIGEEDHDAEIEEELRLKMAEEEKKEMEETDRIQRKRDKRRRKKERKAVEEKIQEEERNKQRLEIGDPR